MLCPKSVERSSTTIRIIVLHRVPRKKAELNVVSINGLKDDFLLLNDYKNNQNNSHKTCVLILRLKPDSGLNPESAHTQPGQSLAHILYNTH